MVSSMRMSTAGTRNGPKTFGSLKSACTRSSNTMRSPPGKRQEERQQAEGRRERGRGDVAAGRHLGSATVRDPAREPEGKDGDVGRRGEEGDGALVVHDLDRRHEVEREEGPDDSDGGSWNALNAEAARGERDRNDDEEHEIRRRGLDDDDPEQREPESRSSLLPDECERQDRDEAEARGGRKPERGRVPGEDEADHDGEKKARRRGRYERPRLRRAATGSRAGAYIPFSRLPRAHRLSSPRTGLQSTGRRAQRPANGERSRGRRADTASSTAGSRGLSDRARSR